jgi:hypothetical protein
MFCQAALFGDRDKIAKVPQFHLAFHISQACPPTYKVFGADTSGSY